MSDNGQRIYKVATEDWEFEQIHRLNYKTFVEEIPQHQPSPSGLLIDKFHDENTYLICLNEDKLLGMVCVRDQRPFSLDQKLPDLDRHLPAHRSVCEIRLLAVDKKQRNSGGVFCGLIREVQGYCKSCGYDLAVVSGTTHQQKFYQRIGCKPFGPLVGSPEAQFQPMYLTSDNWRKSIQPLHPLKTRRSPRLSTTNLMPGPVCVSGGVREAMGGEPFSHRGDKYMELLQETRRALRRMTRARFVELFLGSGTMANDVIAGQLSLSKEQGLILSNGEFGERLLDHARRNGLRFAKAREQWGAPFEEDQLKSMLDRQPSVRWLWAVHCETSTGMLNDIEMLKQICRERGVRLCLDCVSSLGMVPVDLAQVHLASGVSGKALAGCPGLAMVFYDHELQPAPDRLPRCLDLGFYAQKSGAPFTGSSNLLGALNRALKRFQSNGPFEETAETAAWLRGELCARGFEFPQAEDALAAGNGASPVITLALAPELSAEKVGQMLEDAGYALGFRSEYLLERNWIQLAVMGECPRETFPPLLRLLEQVCRPADNGVA